MNSALKRVSKENADNVAPKLLIVAAVFRDSVEAPEIEEKSFSAAGTNQKISMLVLTSAMLPTVGSW